MSIATLAASAATSPVALTLARGTAKGGQQNNVGADKSWDLTTFFSNSTDYATVAGGAFLGLIGMVGIVWGGFLLARKLMSGQQNQDSWIKIVALIIVGGALVFGGMGLLLNFAKGANKTVNDFGDGTTSKGSFIDFTPQAEFIRTWLITKGLVL